MAAAKRAVCIGFTGQGSQWVGMGKALLSQFPKAKELVEEANAVMGYSLSDIMFSGPEVLHAQGTDGLVSASEHSELSSRNSHLFCYAFGSTTE